MKKTIRQKTRFPMLMVVLCAIVLIASIFLPYAVAAEEFTELLLAFDQDPSLSLYDFAVTYLDEGIDGLAIMECIIVGATALAALFAIFRLPFLTILLDIVATGFAALIHFIFASDGTMDSGYFVWGIGDKMILAAGAALFIFAIWLMIAKKVAKKKFVAENE